MIRVKKIPAFTILEMMVGLLISSVVISYGFYALLLLSHQWKSYQDASLIKNEFLLFKKTFYRDIDDTSEIRDSAGAIILTQLHSERGFLQYEFYKNFILRRDGSIADSFRCGSAISDIEHYNPQTNLVTSFRLQTTINTSVIPVFFSKAYTAKELFKTVNQ